MSEQYAMEQPPVMQTEPSEQRKAGLGRIGLYLSLAALLAIGALMMGKPG